MHQNGAPSGERIAEGDADLPPVNGMKDSTLDPRTQVMIMVEASWVDQSARVQKARARMENKSMGGACVRLGRKITVGTRLRIEGQWERFSGEARYCRRDGRDYLVGIQKDKKEVPIADPSKAKEIVVKADVSKASLHSAAIKSAEMKKQEQNKGPESAAEKLKPENVPKASSANWMDLGTVGEPVREVTVRERKAVAQGQKLEGLRKKEERLQQPSDEKEAGKERKHMLRKWFEMGHKGEGQEGLSGNGSEKGNVQRAPAPAAPPETTGVEAEEEGGVNTQLELLSMEDIYRMTGIVTPRKGYSISKIVEMLHSDHLRGLSKEMKRASVLMALDAAGVSVDEVLQDAKARQDAIDWYEAEQRKQFEAQLARKAEENVQIRAELERVKSRYTERLRRNLDGMAREKATFGGWLTLKQQEGQSMAEAVDLCLKPPAPEAPSRSIEDVSLAGARVKPV